MSKQIYSNAVNVLTIEEVMNTFEMIKDVDLPIISVGSGNGELERDLDLLLCTDIICVDPEPLSYIHRKKIYKKPKYDYVKDMEIEKYERNCTLLLNWSNFNGYDIEAVNLLKPKFIINITELGIYRGASSPKMHRFMFNNGVDTDGHNELISNGTFIDDPSSNYDYELDSYTVVYKRDEKRWRRGDSHPNILSIILMKNNYSDTVTCGVLSLYPNILSRTSESQQILDEILSRWVKNRAEIITKSNNIDEIMTILNNDSNYDDCQTNEEKYKRYINEIQDDSNSLSTDYKYVDEVDESDDVDEENESDDVDEENESDDVDEENESDEDKIDPYFYRSVKRKYGELVYTLITTNNKIDIIPTNNQEYERLDLIKFESKFVDVDEIETENNHKPYMQQRYDENSLLRTMFPEEPDQKSIRSIGPKLQYINFGTSTKGERKIKFIESGAENDIKYYHGDLIPTLAKLASNFPGSNNLHLLAQEGKFGTRNKNDQYINKTHIIEPEWNSKLVVQSCGRMLREKTKTNTGDIISFLEFDYRNEKCKYRRNSILLKLLDVYKNLETS